MSRGGGISSIEARQSLKLLIDHTGISSELLRQKKLSADSSVGRAEDCSWSFKRP